MRSMVAEMKAKAIARFPILLFIFIAAFAMLATQTWTQRVNQHAMIRHGQDALDAASCMDGAGTDAGFLINGSWDPEREGHMCFDADTGRWFVLIVTVLGAFVTAYCVESAKRKNDVVRHLKNRGFK